MLTLTRAEHSDQMKTVRMLFEEYADSLGIRLDFQGFDRELADLPGEYAPPQGCLFLAWLQGEAAGCVGVRKYDTGICEMKRLYVRPTFRGRGIGRVLAEKAISKAREMGYTAMRLDTLPHMETPRKLYSSLGFIERDPYRYNPVDGAVFMELDLRE